MQKETAVVLASTSVMMLALLMLFKRPTRSAVAVTRRESTKVVKKEKCSIVNNYGLGDCLFNCFRQIARQLGNELSVSELRAAVADSVTLEQFNLLRQIFKTALTDADYDMLMDYGWMSGVETIEDLRERIKTRSYFGDDLALPVLEEKVGVNALVVSRKALQLRPTEARENRPYAVLILKDVHYVLAARGQRCVFAVYPSDVVEFALSRS